MLSEELLLTKNGLGVYLEAENSLVIADLHIGLEHALMGDGTYLPVLQYPIIERSILDLVAEHKPNKVIINGDFKHEFAKATNQEWTEILNLMDALKKHDVELELVRGNHDNYLINVLKQRGKTMFDPYLQLGSVLITHGHKPVEIPDDVKTLILAHEHPALGFLDETGGKHKFKCYLYGSHNNMDILVLPAYSPMAAGAVVNRGTKPKFMSPYLNEIDTSNFIPIVVDKGEMLKFPPLKHLEAVDIHDQMLNKLEFYEQEIEKQ